MREGDEDRTVALRDREVPLIHLEIGEEDIASIAEAAGVPLVIARVRIETHAKQIAETASQLINEQLVSVAKTGQP
jgi:hypothetical protein